MSLSRCNFFQNTKQEWFWLDATCEEDIGPFISEAEARQDYLSVKLVPRIEELERRCRHLKGELEDVVNQKINRITFSDGRKQGRRELALVYRDLVARSHTAEDVVNSFSLFCADELQIKVGEVKVD